MEHPEPCPHCGSDFVYFDGALSFVCPSCGADWPVGGADETATDGSGGAASGADAETRDAVGNVLQDGDTVVVIKTMSVKGAQQALKAGTKVKNIRLVGGDHDIDCKIPGFGAMKLKSSIVKKA
jgi:protein PhnA